MTISNKFSNYAGGLYKVGDELHANKVDAILKAEQTNNFPYFIFHDEEYSKFNWEIEPTETLEQLYRLRAIELREKYDYLVLHFSGGLDSSNILETFIKNNIPLDEIFIRGPYKAANKDEADLSSENQFSEVYFQSVPVAEMIKNEYLKHIKITIIDTTEFTVECFSKNPDWHQDAIGGVAPFAVTRQDYNQLNPDFAKLRDKGVTVGHILGIDKPMLHYDNNKFYVRFLDKMVSMFAGTPTLAADSTNIEFFYWGRSTAQLICKQAHTIKKYIKLSKLDPTMLSTASGRNYHDMVGSLLYNRTIIPILHTPVQKSKYNALEFDFRYFFKDNHSAHVQNWNKGVQHLNQIIPAKWIHGDSVATNFLVGIWSRSYCIGG
jgi:hypothetical protein